MLASRTGYKHKRPSETNTTQESTAADGSAADTDQPVLQGRRVNGGRLTERERTHKVVTTAADRLRVARASTTKGTPERAALDAHKAVPGGDNEIEKAHDALQATVAVLMKS